ncbi:SHOCT domain-containing protein [Haloferax namakaokahaiae]|uniref:SHOCT domain-containing protein n=1 Tax=Haloferax namakaokahaiae TaxID=1748331 RepID=A0ABD5ZCH4_9EURY
MTTTQTNSTRLVSIVLLALAALFVLPMLIGIFGFGGGPMGWGGAWMHDTWMHGGTQTGVPWWMWGMGILGQLLVLAVIVGGGLLAFRALGGDDEGDDALDELRRAYARGDIDDDEFERRRARLEET